MPTEIKIKSTRDALEKIRDYILTGKSGDGCMAPILNWCDDALSMPERNCDVGTVEEQYQRYEKFCCSHYRIADNGDGNCLNCPFSQPTCKLSWAQLPYEGKE